VIDQARLILREVEDRLKRTDKAEGPIRAPENTSTESSLAQA